MLFTLRRDGPSKMRPNYRLTLGEGICVSASVEGEGVRMEAGGVMHTVGLGVAPTASSSSGCRGTRGLSERELDSPRRGSQRVDSTAGVVGSGLEAVTSDRNARGGVHRLRSLSWRNNGVSADLKLGRKKTVHTSPIAVRHSVDN